MKTARVLFLIATLFLIGCDGTRKERSASKTSVKYDQPVAEPNEKQQTEGFIQNVSLTDAVKADSTNAAYERKIIRDADLTMEVPSTTEAQRKVTSIAESHGGFVVTSEAKQRQAEDPGKRLLDFKLVLRIPENQFGAALNEIEGLATNLTDRKVTGQDVTEEFIDLEARINTQKALEAQFLQIMKQAGKIADALEVQRQIAEVRTEIEKLEGRKRFLENRSSLSTITVNIQSPTPIMASTSGFGRSVREAVSDGVAVASGIVLFLVRFVIVMVPVSVLLLFPVWLAIRYLLRRLKRIPRAPELQPNTSSD